MPANDQHVVIVGGGFAGLYAARALGRRRVRVTLLDKRNFHLFQPLLYQVATGFLSPGEIATPLRTVLARYPSVNVIQDELTAIDPAARMITTAHGALKYDKLIIATGVTHSYFGHDTWSQNAPGIKTVEDALGMRRKILAAFEAAERCSDAEQRKEFLTFAIIGGGPTGVELAGALAELARGTLKGEFRRIDPRSARIILFEGGPRILPAFHPKTSAYAAKALSRLGVTVRTGTKVTQIEAGRLEVASAAGSETIRAGTILWAAGVKASGAARFLASSCGAQLDAAGRVTVDGRLALPNHPEIFVIGDLAAPGGQALPGVAPVAMQQGAYVARLIAGGSTKAFAYFDKGNMAVIGRGRAVAETWKLRLCGFPAWMAWAFVHIFFLIEFENKFVVFFRWAWNYLTDKRGSRIISEE